MLKNQFAILSRALNARLFKARTYVTKKKQIRPHLATSNPLPLKANCNKRTRSPCFLFLGVDREDIHRR